MLAVVMMMCVFSACPLTVNAQESDVAEVGLESTGYSSLDGFINDSRWTNGAYWPGNKMPIIASFQAWGCCAYCADYVKYCYGYNNPRTGAAFYDTSEIRAGDVLTVGNQSDGSGHWFVCLKRNGNSLYVAEGNIQNRVRIGWNYSIRTNKFFNEDSRSFTAGYHYLDDAPPIPSFTPVDLGTYFYAFIINTSSWKHLTVDSNVNITIRSEKAGKSPDQVFRFERQADGSYKIISTANGWCLDVNGASSASGANVSVCSSNDSDAQRWYIDGSSGEYRLKAKCTDCVLDIADGSSAEGTNVRMWEANNSDAQKFQIWRWDSRPEAADIGSGFTAPILNTKAWITLENNNGNVILNKEDGKSHQLWKFQRNLDGSYTIYSCLDGKCIDLYNFLHADGTNIGMCGPNNTNAQRWYIYYNGSYFQFQSKESGKFFDVSGGNLISGANIQAYTWNGSDYQRFSIYGGDECKIKSPTLTVTANNNYSNVVFERNEVYGETGYNLKIWKDEIWKGEAFNIIENVDKETTLVLPAGTYQAYVDAYNYYDIKMSNVVTFTIENDPLLGDVDNDGDVEIRDSTWIQRHVAEVEMPFIVNKTTADVDGDGIITVMDATAIQYYLANMKTTYKIGEKIE